MIKDEKCFECGKPATNGAALMQQVNAAGAEWAEVKQRYTLYGCDDHPVIVPPRGYDPGLDE